MGAIADAQEEYSLDAWPFTWCRPEDARGYLNRIRAGDTRRQVAAEVGVSSRSISRAVRYLLLATGQYDPDGWKAYKSENRRRARQSFLALMAARDEREKRTSDAVRAERQALAQRREAHAHMHSKPDRAGRGQT